jgi:hypothetical protein
MLACQRGVTVAVWVRAGLAEGTGLTLAQDMADRAAANPDTFSETTYADECTLRVRDGGLDLLRRA